MTPTTPTSNTQPYFPSWSSYSSIFHLGHRAVNELTLVPCIVQEKVDGSQFSFGVFGGEIRVRSKGAQLYVEAPEKMFTQAVETVKALTPTLHDGWTYRGEYLSKPRHNVLAYDRVPKGNIILYDITCGDSEFLDYETVQVEGDRIGLEVVPTYFSGTVTLDLIRDLLSTISVLGGTKIEGVVVKPRDYSLFGVDKKVLMGKFVSEAFKEIHAGVWKKDNPTQGDFLQTLIERIKTPARWQKAVQHLREAGTLEESPRDIGPLIKEVQADLIKEAQDEVKEALFKHFWPAILRSSTGGLPEWWKGELLKEQFNSPESISLSPASSEEVVE